MTATLAIRATGAERAGFGRALRAAACAAALLLTPAARATATTAHVRYVSAGNVYLDAGSSSGLAEGMSVRVVRDGKLVAQIVVEFVAENSAACKQSETSGVRVGDACEFESVATPEAKRESSTTVAARTAERGGSLWSNLDSPRGQVSSWYVQSSDPTGTYRNPSLRADVRWQGRESEGLALRVRASRPELRAATTAQTPLAAPGAFQPSGTAELRIYELQAIYRSPAEAFELGAGRMIPSRLELAGYLDGADLHWRPVRQLRLGVAAGRDADLGVRGARGRGRKLGGFVEAAGVSAGWRAVLAAAALEDPEITRRQFAELRSELGWGHRFRLFEDLVADVNPPWKQQRGASRLELSSGALSAQIQAGRRVSFVVGGDSRLPLLLPEQRTLPSFERQRLTGAHASTHLQLTSSTSVRAGGDATYLPGGRLERRAADVSLYSSHLGSRNLAGSIHSTYYAALYGHGVLVDGGLSLGVGNWMRFDTWAGTGETRIEPASPFGTAVTTRTHWLRAAADVRAPHGLWLDFGGEWRASHAGTEFSLELGHSF